MTSSVLIRTHDVIMCQENEESVAFVGQGKDSSDSTESVAKNKQTLLD